MNANELANLLEVDSWYKLVTREEIATMLRQQQTEIEALKQIIDANNLNQNIGQFVKPTNEPVAWMLTLPDGTHDWILDGNGCESYIPLYTHPVELTDEEIDAVGDKVSNLIDTYAGRREFARAILRKAQEK